MHQMWGYVECANQGVVKDFGDFKSRVSGGLSECKSFLNVKGHWMKRVGLGRETENDYSLRWLLKTQRTVLMSRFSRSRD